MAITYDLLTQEEQDDIVIGFLRAQQLDHFTHTLNLARYKDMLAMLPARGATNYKDFSGNAITWKQRVQILHDETVDRIAEVEAIITATEKAAPVGVARANALRRIKPPVTVV